MSSTSSDSDNIYRDNICKYYNPYFGNGCKSGDKCKFKHLKEKEFIVHCTRINKENKPSNATRNTFRAAIDLLKKGKADKAIKKFEKIIKTCPYDELYNMWFARCHEELNNIELAEFYYRKSIAIQPKFATAHGRYAEFSWHKLGNIKQADVHFQKSLQNKENHVTHRHYAQFIEQKFNDYKKSQYHFERCLELSSNDHGAHHSYAIVLQKMNANINKIKYHYQESIKLFDCANIHYSFALYLKNIGENNNAIKHFQKCLHFDPYNSMYHFQFGLFLYQNIGQINDALIHINNALNINPNDPLYKETYHKLKGIKNNNNQNKTVYIKKKKNDTIITDQNKENKNNKINNGILTSKSNWADNPNQQNVLNNNQTTERKCENASQQKHEKQEKIQRQLQPQQLSQSHQLSQEFDEYLQLNGTNKNEEKKEFESRRHEKCEIEFERFVKEKVVSGAAGQYYVDRFNQKKINDIRLIEFIDYTFLKTEIGMNELHVRMMLKKIEKFKKDMLIFINWLHSLKMYDEYYEIFEMNAIITFDLFYNQIRTHKDIINLLGKHNIIDAMYLFNNTPKQNRQNNISMQNDISLQNGQRTNYIL